MATSDQRPRPVAGGGHILIVDDETPLRRVLRRYLEGAGWTVEDTDSAESALTLLATPDAATRYDAVVCDLTMPGMGGIGLCRRLAETSPELLRRVIISTGNVEASSDKELSRYAIASVLHKPFSTRALGDRLKALREERALRDLAQMAAKTW